MSEMEIARLLSSAFGPAAGSVVAVILLVVGGKIIKPQLAGADAQANLIKDLRDESEKWQKLYDETHRLLTEQKETNTLLRIQNAMMRQMLVSKGLTDVELTAIGAVQTEANHG